MNDVSPQSPEERAKRLADGGTETDSGDGVTKVRRGHGPFEVAKRVVVGVYSDGFIHAGNLAYLSLLTLFSLLHRRRRDRSSVRPERGQRTRGRLLPAHASAQRLRSSAQADRRRAGPRARDRCFGSAVSSGCGRSAASSRRSAISCAARMASARTIRSGIID